MSYTKAQRESWGLFAVLPIVFLSLVVLAGFAVLTLHPYFASHAAPAQEPPARTAPTLPVRQVAGQDPPAVGVVDQLLGPDASWGQAMPLPFGCRAPETFAGATSTDGGVTVAMYLTHTGYGQAAMDQLSRCGYRTQVNDRAGVRLNVTAGRSVVWNRGDVLMVVSGPVGKVPDVAATLDDKLSEALTPMCVEQNPTAKDARRNPRHKDYRQYHQDLTVTIPASELDPGDPGDVAVPASLDGLPTLPDGVAGPPLPDRVEEPGTLKHPGEQVVDTQVSIPVYDRSGPGCGWEFTGAPLPRGDQDRIELEAQKVEVAARGALLEAQEKWTGKVEKYLRRVDPYNSAVDAWDKYVTQVRDVSAQWEDQREALDRYNRDLDAWRDSKGAHEQFLADRETASAQYEDAVAACQVEVDRWREEQAQRDRDDADQPPVAPGGEQGVDAPQDGQREPDVDEAPVPEPDCMPKRPAILDREPPVIIDKPDAPQLWEE